MKVKKKKQAATIGADNPKKVIENGYIYEMRKMNDPKDYQVTAYSTELSEYVIVASRLSKERAKLLLIAVRIMLQN